jgi:hypothetical protein
VPICAEPSEGEGKATVGPTGGAVSTLVVSEEKVTVVGLLPLASSSSSASSPYIPVWPSSVDPRRESDADGDVVAEDGGHGVCPGDVEETSTRRAEEEEGDDVIIAKVGRVVAMLDGSACCVQRPSSAMGGKNGKGMERRGERGEEREREEESKMRPLSSLRSL